MSILRDPILQRRYAEKLKIDKEDSPDPYGTGWSYVD